VPPQQLQHPEKPFRLQIEGVGTKASFKKLSASWMATCIIA
jgi:hypothetical protein